LAAHPASIESWYSQGLYLYLSKSLRWVFGWIPFSVGDVFYTFAAIAVFRFFILRSRWVWQHPLLFLRNLLIVFSSLYFVFYFLWGMNYYRPPLRETMGVEKDYTTEDLVEVTQALLFKTNQLQHQLTGNDTVAVTLLYNQKTLFKKSVQGFHELRRVFPRSVYEPLSAKPSLYNTPLSYMGYSGYLNPFTNEAQINKRLPGYKLPVVLTHEQAHQIGFAAEDEASFIGYAAAIYNPDACFQYAGYSYALAQCLRDLERKNPGKFKEFRSRLNPGVLKNYREAQQFWEAYENRAEIFFKKLFTGFLKANNQPRGLQSYNDMVALLVHFHKKYPLKA
jgi:hypothetical protein